MSDIISTDPGFRPRLAQWLERPAIRNTIIGVILFNAVILGLKRPTRNLNRWDSLER